MSAVAYAAKHTLPAASPEHVTERTAQIPIIPEVVTRSGLGWFRPLWHRFDKEAEQRELADPKGLHGKAGGRWVFAECGMTACPDESMVAALSSQNCPVCFPDDSGHLFTWDRGGSHIVARCLRTGCGQTDTETRDPNTGRRRSCKPSAPEVAG